MWDGGQPNALSPFAVVVEVNVLRDYLRRRYRDLKMDRLIFTKILRALALFSLCGCHLAATSTVVFWFDGDRVVIASDGRQTAIGESSPSNAT